MQRPGLLEVTNVFLRLGNTTVGGGEPTMVALQQELTRRGWMSIEQFGIGYGLARITPGTNMLAFCAAAAWYVRGMPAAILCMLAVTVPSSVLVVWLTKICQAGESIPWLQSVVTAVIAAAVGMMLATALSLARSQAKAGWVVPVLFVACACGLRYLGVSPLQTIALGALAGLFWRVR
jgi:chromate transporter